jgi:CBS-domain-containing membrane protein
MKVKELMMGTPYHCDLETNLGAATELMWNGNCGFLPVVDSDGEIRGVVTDRDICIALGTRNRLPGEIPVREVMSQKVFSCSPEDDVHVALQTMKEGRVRRLPVISQEKKLVGVVSMDDVLLRAQPTSLGKEPDLSSDEVVRTYRAISQRQVPQVVATRAAVA